MVNQIKGIVTTRAGHALSPEERIFQQKFRVISPNVLRCFKSHQSGHCIKDFSGKKRTKNGKQVPNQGKTFAIEDGYESAEVLVKTIKNAHSGRILDNEFSLHIMPNKTWLGDFR